MLVLTTRQKTPHIGVLRPTARAQPAALRRLSRRGGMQAVAAPVMPPPQPATNAPAHTCTVPIQKAPLCVSAIGAMRQTRHMIPSPCPTARPAPPGPTKTSEAPKAAFSVPRENILVQQQHRLLQHARVAARASFPTSRVLSASVHACRAPRAIFQTSRQQRRV